MTKKKKAPAKKASMPMKGAKAMVKVETMADELKEMKVMKGKMPPKKMPMKGMSKGKR